MTNIRHLEKEKRKRHQKRLAKAHEEGAPGAMRFEPYVFDGAVQTVENAAGDKVIVVATGDDCGLVMQPKSAIELGLALHQAGLRAEIARIEKERPDLIEERKRIEREAREPAPAPQPSALVLPATDIVVPGIDLGERTRT